MQPAHDPRAITIEDLQAKVPQVLARLNQIAPLPKHGTVAGQAVASVFWEVLGLPLKGPVNDIDVFVNVGVPRHLRGQEHIPDTRPENYHPRTQSTAFHATHASTEINHYEHVKFIALRSTTSILRTYQSGLLNFTLIQSPLVARREVAHDAAISQSLVEGFDLNLVGVGINLDEGKVVATPAFMEFLHSRQIQAQTCNTPAHTLVRLARKVFGGQIEGASCDFVRQRAMLELALQCQEEAGSDLSGVTTFGSGRYKALHAQFAEHLPPVQEIEKPNGDGSSYTFHRLLTQPSLEPADAHLVKLASGQNNLQYPILHTLFVAHFPKVFDLAHPKSPMATSEVSEKLQALYSIDGSLSEFANMRAVCKIVGLPVIDLQVPGFDEDDSFIFFFGQESSKSPEKAQAALDAWVGLTDMERILLANHNACADQVASFAVDRAQAWKTLLRKDGESVLRKLASAPEDFEPQAQAQLRQIIAWSEQWGEEGSRLLATNLAAFETHTDSPSLFARLVAAFDEAHDRENIATRLMKLSWTNWPDLSGFHQNMPQRALIQWVQAGQTITPELVQALSPNSGPALLDLCQTNYRNAINQAYFSNALATLMPFVSAQELLADDHRLLRAVLVEAQGQGLDDVLAGPDRAQVLAALEEVILSWRQVKQEPSPSHWIFGDCTDGHDFWKEPKRLHQAIASAERLLMEQHTVKTQVNAPRRRI